MKYQTNDDIFDAENFATFEEIEYINSNLL